MAERWIKMRCDLHEDSKVEDLCDHTGLDSYAIVGRLHRLWSWVGDHSIDGQMVNTTDTRIDRRVAFDGFASALRSVGWIDGQDREICFVNFEEHNGATAKKRAQDSARMGQKRNSRKIVENDSTREEEIREEKSKKKRGETPPTPPAFDWSKVPGCMDTPEVRSALIEWQAYRRETRRGAWKPRTILASLRSFEKHGPAVWVSAINESIRQGWAGVFEPKGKPAQSHAQRAESYNHPEDNPLGGVA